MEQKPRRIAVIIPARNEGVNLRNLYGEVHRVIQDLGTYTWELIFIDDGSYDGTWEIIEEMSRVTPTKVKGVCLSRHFGKEIAQTVGIDMAQDPDAAIFMDADLQHPPGVIPELVRQWESGFQIVTTQRRTGQDSWGRRLGSNLFYFIFNRFSDLNIQPGACDFRLLDRKILEVLQTFKERNRFFRGIVDWVGFKKTSIAFDSPARAKGNSAFTLKALFDLAIDAFTSFSLAPLRLAGYLGLTVTIITFLLLTYMVTSHIFFEITLFTPLAYFMVFNTLLFGIVLISLGLIAWYIGRIHTEVIDRPLYIIQKRVGFVDE